MPTSWFSITFVKKTSGEDLVFTGHLAVDKYTTLVKGFYDSIYENNMLKPGNTTFNNSLLFTSTHLQEKFDTTSSDFK
jgi:hypothetical protein